MYLNRDTSLPGFKTGSSYLATPLTHADDREKDESFRDKLRRRLESEADLIIAAILERAASGSVAAFDSLLDRAYGKVPVSVERTNDERELAWQTLGVRVAELLARHERAGPSQLSDGRVVDGSV